MKSAIAMEAALKLDREILQRRLSLLAASWPPLYRRALEGLPPTQPLGPSNGLGSSSKLAMNYSKRSISLAPPSAGLANVSKTTPAKWPIHLLCFGAPHRGHCIWMTVIPAPVPRFFRPRNL